MSARYRRHCPEINLGFMRLEMADSKKNESMKDGRQVPNLNATAW
jgi:hypothetical protein